jgi:hypothetical protein
MANIAAESGDTLFFEDEINVILVLEDAGDGGEDGQIGLFILGGNDHEKDEAGILMFAGIRRAEPIFTAAEGENVGLTDGAADVGHGDAVAEIGSDGFFAFDDFVHYGDIFPVGAGNITSLEDFQEGVVKIVALELYDSTFG